MKFDQIIQHLVPGAKMVIVGNPKSDQEYQTNVTWLDERPQPTWSEVQAVKPEVEKLLANKEAEQKRSTAYKSEADPLFFGWQRGENTEQEWLDKVAEIRARHPYA